MTMFHLTVFLFYCTADLLPVCIHYSTFRLPSPISFLLCTTCRLSTAVTVVLGLKKCILLENRKIKHYAIKTFEESEGIAPCFLTSALDGKWVVNFTSCPLYPPPLQYPLERRLDGPQMLWSRKKNSKQLQITDYKGEEIWPYKSVAKLRHSGIHKDRES
jgi:hypothetical protein